ncbi:putative disease resistance protein RGA3 [Coffea arabica]|uniref:Disease resistance protein RGA3 n=1 Tax=Coffea arabica TaxID=13443 RepID=A0A6P6T327_COFAR|nr:putative disease resistance protein RGA3 [Coffea arabica]
MVLRSKKKSVKGMAVQKLSEISLKPFKNCKPKVEELSRADQSVSDVASQSNKSYTGSTTITDLLEMTESSALDQSVSKVALNSITDHERSPKMSCRLFSRLFGPKFEFDKDSMVQLWVARGIFEPENEKIIEIVGGTVFYSMVEDNLFVPVRYDNLYGQLFAVNENMLDSNLFEGEEQLPMEDFMLADEVGLVSIPSTIKHLSLFCENFDLHIVGVLKSFPGMQTLMLHCECATDFNHVSHDLFLHLKHLRTLDLHQLDITELPSSVGDLEYLHYLDVSETSIKYLPETVDSLYLLQTLKLKGCLQLCRLPINTRHLVRLRHLDLDIIGQLKSMPVGLGSLTSLQTLSGFLVGKKDGCYIGELKNLVNLRGSLCISRLENISSPDEAEQANLSNKKHITKLQLQWSTCHSDRVQVEEQILECLQPHFGLKELEIFFFNGSKLPSWISDPSFAQIVKITLFKCRNCSLLPSLGMLPSLQFLEIYEMNGVRVIDQVFHRKNGVQYLHAFPKLEKLELDTLLNLEVWDGMEDGDFPKLLECRFKQCPKLVSLPSLSYLHSLKHLEIIACSELRSLPDDGIPASVETIIVKDCPRIIEQCRYPNARDWSKIEHVSSVFLDYEEISPQSRY